MTRQRLQNGILVSKTMLLAVILYFFWHASSFPNTNDATGIETAEWLWIVLLVAPFLMAFGLVSTDWWRSRSHNVQVIALVTVALLLGLVYFRLPIFDDASFAIDRADWFWLLLLLIPLLIAQWLVSDHAWTITPVDVLFAGFIILCFLSTTSAPFPSRGMGMVMRPLLGLILMAHFISLARISGHLDSALIPMLLLCGLIAYYGLSATQWESSKSAFFEGIIVRLESLPDLAPFGTSNPNEMGGVMAWLIPLVGGMVIFPWRTQRHTLQRASALLLMILIALLILGQSRSALIGVIVASSIMTWLLVPHGWKRYTILGIIGLVIAFQVALVFNLLPQINDDSSGSISAPPIEPGLSARDEGSTQQRLLYWETALAMISDHPLTGVGMNRYRYAVYFEPYTMDTRSPHPPHAHNEILQITTDLGIPGLIVFAGWYVSIGYMVIYIWRFDDAGRRIVAVSAGAGLLAHFIFGLTDSIPLWDRFAFVQWLQFGLIGASYVITRLEIVAHNPTER